MLCLYTGMPVCTHAACTGSRRASRLHRYPELFETRKFCLHNISLFKYDALMSWAPLVGAGEGLLRAHPPRGHHRRMVPSH